MNIIIMSLLCLSPSTAGQGGVGWGFRQRSAGHSHRGACGLRGGHPHRHSNGVLPQEAIQ